MSRVTLDQVLEVKRIQTQVEMYAVELMEKRLEITELSEMKESLQVALKHSTGKTFEKINEMYKHINKQENGLEMETKSLHQHILDEQQSLLRHIL